MNKGLRPGALPLIAALGLLAAGILFSLLLGRYPQPGLLLPGDWSDPVVGALLWHSRLPRIVAALLLGMTLAGAGTVFQMILANPLVEPGFLGVSQGGAFGAALGIVLLGGSAAAVQGLSLLFAAAGLALSYFLARRIRFGGWILRLVLSGMAVSALFTALLGLIKYNADPLAELPEIAYWMLGGLWGITWIEVIRILPLTLLPLTLLWLFRWRLNLLSLEDAASFSLGGSPGRLRIILLLCGAAATAAVVSVSGIVSWVGLMVPAAARRITGSDARRSLPLSMIYGALFVLLCDDAARTLFPGEIPLGIVTALLGALLFLLLFTRRRLRRIS